MAKSIKSEFDTIAEGETVEQLAPPRRPFDPLPGVEQPHTFEQSVQSQYLDEYGREKPNPLPLAPPVGYVKRKTIAETIREAIAQASFEAAQRGAETEAEADDFDVGEDMEPHSPWENDFELDPALEAMLALQSAPPAEPAPPAKPAPPASSSATPSPSPTAPPQQ